MNMEIRRLFILYAVLFPGTLFATDVNLFVDNTALIDQIKRTDYVFTTALVECSSEKVSREDKNFVYEAVCKARATRSGDCTEYKVKARGTIDTKTWATVRKLQLELQCYG